MIETRRNTDDQWVISLDRMLNDSLAGLNGLEQTVMSFRTGQRTGQVYSIRRIARVTGLSEAIIQGAEHSAKNRVEGRNNPMAIGRVRAALISEPGLPSLETWDRVIAPGLAQIYV